MATVKVTVRDGRAGRESDPDAPEGWGQILAEFEQPAPLDEGDTLILSDGDKVMVIGTTERITGHSHDQVVHVGSFPRQR